MNDLILKALRNEPAQRRPVWIMRQAGRYLPEYRALREKHSFEELCEEPELAAEVTLQPMKRFPLDAAIVFADLVTPLTAVGRRFKFVPGPVLDTPVRTAEDIAGLPEREGEEIGAEVMATLRIVKRELGGRAALLGFGGAPWSLAAYLVEGRHVAGFPTLRAMAAGRPDLAGELLGKLARLVAKYLVEQHRAGADAVQVFDTWAGLLSAEDWKRLVRPHLTFLLEELGKAGVPRIMFVQDAPHLLDLYAALPHEVLATDWRIDLGALRERLGASRGVQGNLDPAMLLAGPQVARAGVRDLLRRVPARGHIVNLGHGILPETPIASVEAFVGAVHEHQEETSA